MTEVVNRTLNAMLDEFIENFRKAFDESSGQDKISRYEVLNNFVIV